MKKEIVKAVENNSNKVNKNQELYFENLFWKLEFLSCLEFTGK